MRIFKRRFIAVFALCLLWECLALSAFALEHIVQKDDTLYCLSKTYGLSVDEICRINKIDNASSIKIGQPLTIPVAAENAKTVESVKTVETVKYTVQKGDTLYSIARAIGMKLADLLKLNGLSESSMIKAGQILKIPASAAAPPASPKPSATPKPPAAATQRQTTIQWPVPTSSITYMNGKISGVQLTTNENESVVAINSGTVIYSGIYRGYGNVVLVKNESGYTYVYAGMGNLSLNPGKQITSSDVLGTVGVDSESGNSQLILMVYQENGKAIDPASAPRN